MLLTMPNSVKGLDFDALIHVYTLYLPMDDPKKCVNLGERIG